MQSGNKKLKDPVDKANLFNETFCKISNICKQKFAEEEKFHEEIEQEAQGFLEKQKHMNGTIKCILWKKLLMQ